MDNPSLTSWFYSLFEATGNLTLSVILWFCASVFLALLLHSATFLLLRKFTKDNGPWRRIISRISGLTRLAVVLLAIFIALPVAEFEPDVAEAVRRVLQIGMIAMLGWAAILTVNTSADYMGRQRRLDVEDNLEARRIYTQIGILRRTLLIIIGLITAGAILMTFPTVQAFGVSLFASAGVAGLVLGFAARPILTNLIAGFQIALTQPIRIDDVVIVEGEWGWIEEITTTYVVIRIWDLRRLIVPLSHFIENPFQNWTRESASIIGAVTWHLDYTAPIDLMREKLHDFLKGHKLWDQQVANLQVIDAEHSVIKVRALVSAKNSPNAWDLRCDIREKMISWLKSEHATALPRIRASVNPLTMDTTDR